MTGLIMVLSGSLAAVLGVAALPTRERQTRRIPALAAKEIELRASDVITDQASGRDVLICSGRHRDILAIEPKSQPNGQARLPRLPANRADRARQKGSIGPAHLFPVQAAPTGAEPGLMTETISKMRNENE